MNYRKVMGWAPLLVLAATALVLSTGGDEADAGVRRFTHARVFNGGKTVVAGVVVEYPKGRGPGSVKLKLRNPVPSGGHAKLPVCGCSVVRTIRVLACLADAGKGFQVVYPRRGDALGERTIQYVHVLVGSTAKGKPSAQAYIRLSDGSFVIRTMKPAAHITCAKEGHGLVERIDQVVGDGSGGTNGEVNGTDNYPFVNVRLRNDNTNKRPVKKVVVKGFKGSNTTPTTMYELQTPIPSPGAAENEVVMGMWASRIQITVWVDHDSNSATDDKVYYAEFMRGNAHAPCMFIEEVEIGVGGTDGEAIQAQVYLYSPMPNPPGSPVVCADPDPIAVPEKQ